MRLRLRTFGDVGEGLDEAAVGQMAAAHLDHGPVGHGAFADRELLVLGRRTRGRRIRRAALLGVTRLVLDELVEPRRALDELARQIEQLAAAPVDDGNLQVLGDEHDALAHVLEREPKLVRLEARTLLGLKNTLHRHQHDQRQDDARNGVERERRPRALVDLVHVGADTHPQRLAGYLAQSDEPHLAVGRVGIFERAVRALAHLGEQLGAAQILSECEAVAAAAARAHETVAADQRDRNRRSEIDAIVELGEVLGIERGDDDAAETAVAVEEAARHLDRPSAAGAPDHRLADVERVVGVSEMELVVIAIA